MMQDDDDDDNDDPMILNQKSHVGAYHRLLDGHFFYVGAGARNAYIPKKVFFVTILRTEKPILRSSKLVLR